MITLLLTPELWRAHKTTMPILGRPQRPPEAVGGHSNRRSTPDRRGEHSGHSEYNKQDNRVSKAARSREES
jgi:hypothetical protein